MKHILLFGAGRSATHLIRYLLDKAEACDWHVTIVDANIQLAIDKIGESKRGTAIELDIFDEKERQRLITSHDLVISLLPARLHDLVAHDCLSIGRHLCTASYVSECNGDRWPYQGKKKGTYFHG